MTKLNVALVGAGFMGGMHARVVGHHPMAALSVVVDTRPEAAAKIADEFGATATDTIQMILDRDDVQACIVALPDLHHVDATCQLLRAGKTVLLEKPIAHTVEAAQTIVDAARSGPGRLMTGHLLRFDPRYARAADLVQSGEVGEVLEVRALRLCAHPGERAMGSSTRFLVGIHDMDAIQWITGQRVVEVFARSRVDAYPQFPYGIDDVVHCSLRFDGGAIGSLTYGWTLPPTTPWGLVAGLDITGTAGSLHLEPADTSLMSIGPSGPAYQDTYYWPAMAGSHAGDLGAEVDHFLMAAATDTPFRVDLDGPLAAVALSDAIERSLRSGAPSNVHPAG